MQRFVPTDLKKLVGIVAKGWVILDSCSLINFYASGFFKAILSCVETQICVVQQVSEESLFVRKPIEPQQKFGYEPIILDAYYAKDQLKLLELETEREKSLFVELARLLDDGEAATLALAIERKMIVVTDDRKAIRILQEEAPRITIWTTLDVIKTWQEINSVTNEDVRTALENIRVCANYQPSLNHRLFSWWHRT